MSRYRSGDRATGGRAGWLFGEVLLLVVVAAGLAVVGLPGTAAQDEAADAAPRPSPAASTGPRPSTADTTPTRTGTTAPAAITATPAERPAPVPPDQPLVLAASDPTRLVVPAIGIDTSLVGLGLRADGAMQVPAAAFPAGWYTGAPTPGELGPAVLAGHVDYAGAAGVFSALHELAPGDEVTVLRQDGSTAVFGVTQVGQYDKDAFPTDAVYGDLDHAGLRLITCGGAFDRGARSYVDNIVVFAELVEARPA